MTGLDQWVDLHRYPIDDPAVRTKASAALDRDGALVMDGFFRQRLVDEVLHDATGREAEAFYATGTHTVWLDDGNPTLPPDHVVNRQIVSSKGLLADDQLDPDSPLREVYDNARFRSFIAAVVGAESVHPYADTVSSINVHFHRHGEELGWHFDNSAFAVTALMQAPTGGGRFEFVPAVRDSAAGDQNPSGVQSVLDGDVAVRELVFAPGDLVLFRGRDAMHRVTPSLGDTTRVLVVFAFNETPGIALSDSARRTFYGRTADA